MYSNDSYLLFKSDYIPRLQWVVKVKLEHHLEYLVPAAVNGVSYSGNFLDAGSNSIGGVAWGLPFFYGVTVYTPIEGGPLPAAPALGSPSNNRSQRGLPLQFSETRTRFADRGKHSILLEYRIGVNDAPGGRK